MNKKYLMAIVLAFLCFNVNAQNIEDFEGCGDGTYPGPWWNGWGGCTWPCYFLCADDIVHNGEWAGMMPSDETTDIVLDLGNRIFGEWGLGFWMYVPSNREAYFNLQGTVPIGAGEWIVGNIFFNHELLSPGVGLIDDAATGDVYFNFPHDEWFRIVMNVDISGGIGASTWEFNVDYTEVVPAGTPFTDSAGTYPTSLGGVDFYSISTDCEWYIDDIDYTNGFIDPFALTTDDMEDYIAGQPIFENWWGSWGCGSGAGCALMASSAEAHSGSISGLVPGDATTSPDLDLGNQTSGERGLEFYMYVPENKEAYFNLQGEIPIGAGEWIVGNIFFNENLGDPGIGYIDDSALGVVNFDFPHNEWFPVVMNFDLTNGMNTATWEFRINNTAVIPAGTAFTDFSGTVPTSLGGISFFSISTDNEYYIDDFDYRNGFILATNDFKEFQFSVYPNPVSDRLYIASEVEIDEVKIYALEGSLVLESGQNENIDVSKLSSGIYFVEVHTSEGKSVQKLIKK